MITIKVCLSLFVNRSSREFGHCHYRTGNRAEQRGLGGVEQQHGYKYNDDDDHEYGENLRLLEEITFGTYGCKEILIIRNQLKHTSL